MNIQVTPLTLPAGFCPVSYQDLWNTFAANSQVVIPDALSQTIWQTTPPADHTAAWGKLDSNGYPIGIYYFSNGQWLSRHPLLPGLTMWWFDALPDFTSFDGGDANATISAASGAMWRLALCNGNLIAAKFPIAAGTLPSSTVLTLGSTGGEEKHILSTSEAKLGSHFHYDGLAATAVQGGDPTNYSLFGMTAYAGIGTHNTPAWVQNMVSQTGAYANNTSTAGDATANDSHNTMPPYITGYLIQRTSRLYFVG